MDGARSIASPGASRATSAEWTAVVDELGDALDEHRSEREIRALIRSWCAEARQSHLAPEEFLVMMKNQFVRIPALRGCDEGSFRNMLREHIVSMCIEEYFST